MADEPTQPQSAESQAAAAQQASVPGVAPGPWQSDIESVFTDPQVRAQVDTFLRSKIQPRMTNLEQQVAVADGARQLWDAFQQDPAAAYAAITTELYGQEAGQAALSALEQRLAPPPAQAAPDPAQGQAAPPSDPRIDEMYNSWREERELAAYDAEIARITADPANADIDPNLIHTFIAAADGDFNEGIARYRSFAGDFLAKYGVTPQQASTEAAAAPPVMGGDAGGAGAPPPVVPQYTGHDGLHQAIDDTVSAMRRNAAAPPIS